MSHPMRPLLLESLLQIEKVRDLSLADWDLMLRQAWHAQVLAALAQRIQSAGLMERVPVQPKQRLQSFLKIGQRHQQAMRWEAKCIVSVLQPLGIKPVFLKGVAYLLAELPAASGRLFSDVDILVPRERLAEVEQAFLDAGWVQDKTDAYDQRYFREWMHELPPLRNQQRQMVIDIHHNILPDTAANTPDASKLFEKLAELEAVADAQVFDPTDMVIHSATHLFSDGELEHGLRDLLDLDGLLRYFAKQNSDFYPGLLQRAEELGLHRSLYYALRYTHLLLDTPLPPAVETALQRFAPANKAMMDSLFRRALMPNHPSCDDRWTGLARWLLYVRSHYLRMPMYLLIPHLIRKAWMRRFSDEGKAESN